MKLYVCVEQRAHSSDSRGGGGGGGGARGKLMDIYHENNLQFAGFIQELLGHILQHTGQNVRGRKD